jgi:DNA invertase Pin-like site-specific DNA recombinase
VFVDHGESSRIRDRPQWLACLDYLRPGDTLIVRVLDRLAGTTTMAIETINELHDRGVNIKSLTESDIDTRTPMGRAVFGIDAVFAQLRVDTIRDNTQRGLKQSAQDGASDASRTPELVRGSGWGRMSLRSGRHV